MRYVLLIFLIPFLSFGQQLAFPDAVGAARYASGGRGGQVLIVDTLSDNPADGLTFREAMLTSGPRIIVFAVSGRIVLNGDLRLDGASLGNFTIAGQTAPQGGIVISGGSVGLFDLSNVIIRYVRFRPSIDNNSLPNDALTIRRSNNVIVDHCSLSNGPDEAIDFSDGGADKFTLSYSLLQESKTGVLIAPDDNGVVSGEASVFRNLITNISHRTPNSSDNAKTESVNNVIYNWWNRLSNLRQPGTVQLSMINNYYKPGPYTTARLTEANIETGYDSWYRANVLRSDPDFVKVYASGNYWEDHTGNVWENVNANNDLMHWAAEGDNTPLVDQSIKTQYISSTRFARSEPLPTNLSAQEAYTLVLAEAGAWRTLDGSGNIVTYRDVQDTLGIYRTSTGTYPNFGDNGTYERTAGSPTYGSDVPNNTRAVGYDTDSDGMPDVWEVATFGSLSRTGTADFDGDGFTDVEEYLNLVDSGAGVPTPTNIPQITRTDSNPTSIELGGTYTPPTGTWTDVEDGSGTATVGGDTVNVNVVGEYIVTLFHTDTDGNTGSISITYQVFDPGPGPGDPPAPNPAKGPRKNKKILINNQ